MNHESVLRLFGMNTQVLHVVDRKPERLVLWVEWRVHLNVAGVELVISGPSGVGIQVAANVVAVAALVIQILFSFVIDLQEDGGKRFDSLLERLVLSGQVRGSVQTDAGLLWRQYDDVGVRGRHVDCLSVRATERRSES